MIGKNLMKNLIRSVIEINENVKILFSLVNKVVNKNVGTVGDVAKLPSDIILSLKTVNEVIDVEKRLEDKSIEENEAT